MAKLIPVEVFDLLIFGGTGDLAMRKLLPALYHRFKDQQIPEDSRIISASRGQMAREEYLQVVEKALRDNLKEGEFDQAHWQGFSALLYYVTADAFAHDQWGGLKDILDQQTTRTRVAYLATAPSLFGSFAKGLSNNELITPQTRIVLEKPLGRDQQSAHEINEEIAQCFNEDQIYRIDHYLGKETVQNLLALRFANSLFEPLWRRRGVNHVQITVAEELGVGGRTEFYNKTGALRDMVQNHMMQLLCLIAMEPPTSLQHDAVRDEKTKVLRALKPIVDKDVLEYTVRGQYTEGVIGGAKVPGFEDELGGDQSNTETFVAIKAEIENWRWANVPFYLRTGKRLKEKVSEIVIQFHDVPHSMFPVQKFKLAPNRLVIRLQPDEGMKLSLMAKEPGPGGFNLQPVSLDLSFQETFGVRYPDAYERLLVEVLRGNPALFMRRDEVETAWQWVDGIIAGWESTQMPTKSYVSGSWGPTASSLLLDRDDLAWRMDN